MPFVCGEAGGEGRRRCNGGALEEEDVVIGIEKEEVGMGKRVGYEGKGCEVCMIDGSAV